MWKRKKTKVKTEPLDQFTRQLSQQLSSLAQEHPQHLRTKQEKRQLRRSKSYDFGNTRSQLPPPVPQRHPPPVAAAASSSQQPPPPTPPPRDTSMRFKIISEILETEIAYVNNLKFCLDHYRSALLAQLLMKNCKPILQQTQISTLFGNLDVLYKFQQQFLNELKERVSSARLSSDSSTQISSVFERFAPFLKLYKTYSENYPASNALYTKLMSSSSFFEWQKEQRQLATQATNGEFSLDLGAYLIQPIQRIPRYNLLLCDLIKHTPVKDRAKLVHVRQLVETTAAQVNNVLHQTENAQKMLKFQRLFGNKIHIFSPQRFLVAHGKLKITSEKTISGSKERHVLLLLFNDVLIIGRRTSRRGQTLKSRDCYSVDYQVSPLDAKLETHGAIQLRLTSSISSSAWVSPILDIIFVVKSIDDNADQTKEQSAQQLFDIFQSLR